MILKILELENFGPFKKKVLKFNETTNLISGDNGSGKSHIIDAILLLLYNQTRTKLKNFINWTSIEANIKLEGSINNNNFIVSIKLTDKDTERELTYKNETYQNSDAVKKLDELLNNKLALNSSVVKQGENDLITSRPAERRELLKKVYNLNYQEIIKELENDIKKYKDTDLKKIDNEIYLFQNKEYSLEKIVELNEEDYNNLKINIEHKEKDYYKNLKEQENIDQYHQKVKELNSKLSLFTIEKNIIEKENIELDIKKINELSSNPEQLNSNLEKYEKELKNLDKINDVIKNYEDENSQIRIFRVKAFDNEGYDNVKKELIQVENNLYIEKDNIKKLENGICPTCDTKNLEKNIDSKKDKLVKYENTMKELKEKKEKLEKGKKDYDEQVIEQENCQNKKKELYQKIESLQKEYSFKTKSLEEKIIMEKNNIETQIKNWEEKKDNLETNLKKINELIKKEENEKKLINDEISEITKILENQKGMDISKLKTELGEYKSELQKLDELRIINEKNNKRNKEIEEQKKLDEKSISLFLDKKTKLDNKIKESERCRIIFQKEFPNFIIQELIIDIENEINEFLDETYEGLYHLKIKEKKDAINILFGPKDSDVLDASKYEQTIFSNAYKYALWKILNNKKELNYPLLLDEADNFASEKNSIIFYKYLLNNIDSQTIIITHTNSTKSYILTNSDCKLFELEKDKINE